MKICKKFQCPLSGTHILLGSKDLGPVTPPKLCYPQPAVHLKDSDLLHNKSTAIPGGHHMVPPISICFTATESGPPLITSSGLIRSCYVAPSLSFSWGSAQSWVFYCKGGFTFTGAYHGISQCQVSVASHETIDDFKAY